MFRKISPKQEAAPPNKLLTLFTLLTLYTLLTLLLHCLDGSHCLDCFHWFYCIHCLHQNKKLPIWTWTKMCTMPTVHPSPPPKWAMPTFQKGVSLTWLYGLQSKNRGGYPIFHKAFLQKKKIDWLKSKSILGWIRLSLEIQFQGFNPVSLPPRAKLGLKAFKRNKNVFLLGKIVWTTQ